ncbi:MAG: glycerol-3-phosphate dehydrogenase/oxidase [Leptospiraceae bacterium]|nr:glycerol-3-phosphate dehydrogenase/oxidase [Leptospiraceae bacterium]
MIAKKKSSRFNSINHDEILDLVIIGGGITGASILWDATLRGMKSVLVEKNDFTSGTSQATSKLIHGGLRYLKNGEISLVRESLRERRILAKLTPHSIRPLGFQLPVYSLKNKIVLGLGLTLYDLLSYDKNFELNSDTIIPNHKFLDIATTQNLNENIYREKLKGSFLYFDYANINPERHTSEFIFSAKNRGGRAFNYTEVISFQKKDDLFEVEILDKLSKAKQILKSRTIVNASGPWADLVDGFSGKPSPTNLVRSKGIHVVLDCHFSPYTHVVQTKEKTHLFIIPWRGKTILGTTDSIYKGDPDSFEVTKNDIWKLLEEANEYINYPFTINSVKYFYGGMRPLVDDSRDSNSTETYSLSRKTSIEDHESSGLKGYFTALGGKYTTSRNLAEKVVDKISVLLYGNKKSCLTENIPLDSGNFSDIPSLSSELRKEFVGESIEKIYFLTQRYGSLTRKILNNKSNKKGDSFRLPNGEHFFEEEIEYSIKNEEIHFITDLLFRRSGIGTTGMLSEYDWNKFVMIYLKYSGKKNIEKEIVREIQKRYMLIP